MTFLPRLLLWISLEPQLYTANTMKFKHHYNLDFYSTKNRLCCANISVKTDVEWLKQFDVKFSVFHQNWNSAGHFVNSCYDSLKDEIECCY